MWVRGFRTQELCKDAAPLKAIAISSYNHRELKCQEEANKPENDKANFIVVLYGNDGNGNNCFLYEKCDNKDLKRRLRGFSFQKKRGNIY